MTHYEFGVGLFCRKMVPKYVISIIVLSVFISLISAVAIRKDEHDKRTKEKVNL